MSYVPREGHSRKQIESSGQYRVTNTGKVIDRQTGSAYTTKTAQTSLSVSQGTARRVSK